MIYKITHGVDYKNNLIQKESKEKPVKEGNVAIFVTKRIQNKI